MNFFNIFLFGLIYGFSLSNGNFIARWTPKITHSGITESSDSWPHEESFHIKQIFFDKYIVPLNKPMPIRSQFAQVDDQFNNVFDKPQNREDERESKEKVNPDSISITSERPETISEDSDFKTKSKSPKGEDKPKLNPDKVFITSEKPPEDEKDKEEDSKPKKKPSKDAEKDEDSTKEEEEEESKEKLSPFEEVIKDISKPEFYIPIFNDITFVLLILLFMPAIVPAIMIPLSFYAVGSLLIPIVRVNYYVNRYLDPEGEGI